MKKLSEKKDKKAVGKRNTNFTFICIWVQSIEVSRTFVTVCCEIDEGHCS